MRVVFDTNILFSAIGWGGNPARCVERVESGHMQGVTCGEILDELSQKLSFKLNFTDEHIGVALASLLTFFEVVVISGAMRGLQPDPKDDKILECALVSGATHLVTGDRKHLLPLREFRGTQIVTPAELLQILKERHG